MTYFSKKKHFLSSASMCLPEHEKFSCHLQVGVQWFEADQRLTKGACWTQVITFIIFRPTKLSLCLAVCECK